jgi:hypothetical protein
MTSQLPSEMLRTSIYITRPVPQLDVRSNCGNYEKEDAVADSGEIVDGWPDVKALIHEATASPRESIGIAVCGPSGMCFHVKEAAAEAQRRVWDAHGPKEIYLHTEAFS